MWIWAWHNVNKGLFLYCNILHLCNWFVVIVVSQDVELQQMLLNYRELLMKLPPLLTQVQLVIRTKVRYLMRYTMPLCFCEERKLVALFLSGGISLSSTVLCPFHTDTGHCSADVTEFQERHVVKSDPSTVGVLETHMQEGQMFHSRCWSCMLSSSAYLSVPYHLEHDVKELQRSLEVKKTAPTADSTATESENTMDGGQTLHKHLIFCHRTLGHGFWLCIHTEMWDISGQLRHDSLNYQKTPSLVVAPAITRTPDA